MVWEGAPRGRCWEGCISPETSRPELKDCLAACPLCDLQQAVSLLQASLQSSPGLQEHEAGVGANHWCWVGQHRIPLPWAINSTSQSLECPDPWDTHDNGTRGGPEAGQCGGQREDRSRETGQEAAALVQVDTES